MQIEELSVRLDNVETCVRENYRALRGRNGDTGLVAKVEIMDGKLNSIDEKLSNDLQHVVQLIETKMQSQAEKSVSWLEIAKSWFVPVILALVTAWAMVRFGPG